MRLQAVKALLPLTDTELCELRELWRHDALRVGAALELGKRTVIVRGFDPASLPDRCIYLADTDGKTFFAVPMEDVER